MTLRIAVNKNCFNKENVTDTATGWLNINESVEWLMGWVQAGYGWCATHFVDRHRLGANARSSNLIVVDIDGDTTLGRFWQTDTARDWCAATYTSASHTEQEHRFRALFPLEMQLDTVAQHRGAYWLIVHRLIQELGIEQLKDNCGQKPERLWYGNTKATVELRLENAVPSFLLENIDYEEDREFISADLEEIDIKRCQYILRHLLRPSDDGEYESYYVPVMAACAGIGEVIFKDWQDWVLRGHHGAKEENIRPFKWRGLGNFSGHTTLYSLAKKQNPNWTQLLPPELRFRAAGSAVGYTEFDPLLDLDNLIGGTMNSQVDNVVALEPLPDMPQAKRKGRPKKTNDDAAKEREDDVRKVKEVLHDLRKNQLTGSIEYTDSKGKTVALQGNDLELMTTKLACENGIFIPEPRVKAAVQYAASRNSYCPIRQYLLRCEAEFEPHQEWDHIGERFLGNSHQLATTAMQRMMIGAVARAFNPGCSMSWLPILVGAQGVGKSMFARNLVPNDLFSEITTPLDTLMREQYRMHVAWLLELPEIDNYFNTRNIENFKNLITTRCDEVRYPYAALPSKLHRRFVLIGTTNRNQFLIDSTGNRRFVPLEIASGFQIPWRALAMERDNLWSAAMAAYREHESYEFNSGEIAAISEYIQEFGDPDPWFEKVATYVSIRSEVTAAEVLAAGLDLDARQQGRRESRRVADCLQSMGWRRLVTSRKDPITGKSKSVRVWQRPKDDPLIESHLLNDF